MNMLVKIRNYLTGKEMSIVAKATMWYMVCSVIQKSLSLITTPFFTRIMSTEQMGQFTAYSTWLQIFTILTTFRLDYGVFNKGMSVFTKDRNGYTSSMLGITSVLTFVWAGIYFIFREQVNSLTELSTFVTILIFVELFFSPAISFWSLSQRYEYRYKSVVFVTLSMAIVNTVIGIITVNASENKGIVRILVNALVCICVGIVLYILCIKKGKKIFCFEYVKYAIFFNLPLIPHYFSSYILEQSDKIMIQKIVGQAQMAIYGVACSIAQIIKIITSSITNSLLPWQYRALENKEYSKVGKRITAVVFIVEILVVLFIFIAPEVLYIMASNEYQEAMYVIPPISCSVLVILYFGLVANIEFYFGKNKFVMYVSITCAVLNVIMNYFGITYLGYLAAAYATYVCYTISGFLHLVYTNKLTMKVDGVKILKFDHFLIVAVSTAFAIVLVTLLYEYFVIRYIVLGVLLGVMILFRKKVVYLLNFVKD